MYDFFHSVPGAIVFVLTVIGPVAIYSGIKDFKAWDRGHVDRLVPPETACEVSRDQPQSLAVKLDASTLKSRARFATAIRWFTYAATLVVLWQAVRFCQGQVGAPLLDQIIPAVFGEPHALKRAGDFAVWGEFLAWGSNAMYYLSGIVTWSSLALFIKACGWTIARIIEIGFAAYTAEVEEERRRDEIRLRRYRRAESLKGQSAERKSAFPWAALALGIILGKLL